MTFERARRGVDFEQTIQQHYEDLYRFAYRMLGCTEKAEDVAQETLLRMARNGPAGFEGESARRRFGFLRSFTGHAPSIRAGSHLDFNTFALQAKRRRAAALQNSRVLRNEKEVRTIDRMAGARVPGFHNPVNPVILSKIQIEILQTCTGIEPLNDTGMNSWAILIRPFQGETHWPITLRSSPAQKLLMNRKIQPQHLLSCQRSPSSCV